MIEKLHSYRQAMERSLFKILFRKLQQKPPNYAIRNLSLSFKHFGDGADPDDSTVFILHGLLANKKYMESIGWTLSNLTKQEVITLDMRNHGDSPHSKSHRYKDMAMDIHELMKKQGIDKATLLGHSTGGRVAMSLALMKPKLISGIIIVDISPVSSCKQLLFEYPRLLEEMKKVNFQEIKTHKVAKARRLAKKILREKIPDSFALDSVVSNINAIKGRAMGWTCNIDLFLKNFMYIALFPKILLENTYQGPALFIGGQHSDFIPPDDLPRIREIFPRSVIKYVPKTGHFVHYEDPKIFTELVLAFLKDNK